MRLSVTGVGRCTSRVRFRAISSTSVEKERLEGALACDRHSPRLLRKLTSDSDRRTQDRARSNNDSLEAVSMDGYD